MTRWLYGGAVEAYYATPFREVANETNWLWFFYLLILAPPRKHDRRIDMECERHRREFILLLIGLIKRQVLNVERHLKSIELLTPKWIYVCVGLQL